MEIYINDEKTSYELEDEKNSLDVIDAISKFALKSNPQHFITKTAGITFIMVSYTAVLL